MEWKDLPVFSLKNKKRIYSKLLSAAVVTRTSRVKFVMFWDHLNTFILLRINS